MRRTCKAHRAQLDSTKAESQKQVDDLQRKVGEYETLITTLRASVEAKSTEAGQIGDVLLQRTPKLRGLMPLSRKLTPSPSKCVKSSPRRLKSLRQARQETIALYEERLGATESRRFELEDTVEELEEKIRRRAGVPTSPRSGDDKGEAAAILDESRSN